MKLRHHSADQAGGELPKVAACETSQQPREPLQFNCHRHYDPTPGQWLSEEPIGWEGLDENLRRYVGK